MTVAGGTLLFLARRLVGGVCKNDISMSPFGPVGVVP